MDLYVIDRDCGIHEVSGDAFSIEEGILQIYSKSKAVAVYKEWCSFEFKEGKGFTPSPAPEEQKTSEIKKQVVRILEQGDHFMFKGQKDEFIINSLKHLFSNL
jgi:hypothetical protein